MMDSFKKYFVTIQFSQIPRIDNKDVDAMATIASMLQLSKNQNQYEFLVQQFFSPTYDNPKIHIICHLTDSNSPLYGKNNTYLKDNI
jgi:hypothetical protein